MLTLFFVFLFGLALGSFANVLIYRTPKGELPWKPAFSYCPDCRKPILFYDNIPLASYLLLKGKCRFCRKKISPIYPTIEFLTAALLTLVFLRITIEAAWHPLALIAFSLFVFVLIVITAIDFKTFTIPDSLSLGLACLMLVLSPWNFLLGQNWLTRLCWSFASALIYGLFFWLLAYAGEKIYKKEALGGGDVKLAVAIGAALGIKNLYFFVVLSSFFGLAYALPLLFSKRLKLRDPIAFGPFLAIAAAAIFLLGPRIAITLNFPKNH